MTTKAPDMAQVLARVANLEKQNRRLKTTMMAIALTGSVALLMGQAAPQRKVLEAEKLLLRDSNGVVRIEANVAGPFLSLRDTYGVQRALLTISQDEPALAFYDSNPNSKAHMSIGGKDHHIAIFDDKWTARVEMSMKNGRPSFVLRDAEGKDLFSKP